jgi:flagellar basal-body rod protein FlgF
MSHGIYSALAGAIAQERTLEVVANNLANVNTTGFKGDKVAFSEMTAKQNGAQPASMRFVSLDRIAIDGSAGGVQQTGNPLDLALEGDAYFAVQGPGGERYTRAGSFTTDSEGTIRTHGGYEVLGESGTLSIPQGTKTIKVGSDGTVHADGQEIGKLKLVSFASTAGLVREGLTMFSAGGGATPEPAEVGVAQGYLENANVNAVMGMTELITVNRSFDALQKVIDTFKQLDERTARELGK